MLWCVVLCVTCLVGFVLVAAFDCVDWLVWVILVYCLVVLIFACGLVYVVI